MKVLFIGSVQFSHTTLAHLLTLPCEVVGVVTKSKSNINSDFVDLGPLCRERGVPVLHTGDVNSEKALSWARSLQPDITFCFGWSSLLKREFLNLAPMGVVGYHPAALPANRGRHPIIWPLVLGLERTASTFFFMDEGADSGDILDQRPVDIAYEDDAGTLYDKLTRTALEQMERFVPALASGDYPRIVQDHSRANTWRKRGKPDGKIDFRMSSRAIYNLVRALTRPYVGAHIEREDGDVIVWKAAEARYPAPNLEPGKVLEQDGNRLLVKCGLGEEAILLTEHEYHELPPVGSYL